MSLAAADAARAGVAGVASVSELRLTHGRVPALDGLRGLAIALVMLFHMSVVTPVGRVAQVWHEFTSYGALGVDVFFVLSGFLITGILLDVRGTAHYFRNFYARRILRIFPLYYALVFFSLCILPRVAPWTVAKFGRANDQGIWYWLHLSNFAIARRGAFIHGILDVSWSLSIEEQFYLIWPAVVLFARRRLNWICAALVIMSCASRLWLTIAGATPVAVYTLTFCRLDGLASGGLLALAFRTRTREALVSGLRRSLIITSLLLVSLAVPAPLRLAQAREATILNLIVSLLTSCAIASLSLWPQGSVARLFCASPLRALGRYSYALYLFHYPIMAAIRDKVISRSRPPPLIFHSSFPVQIIFSVVATAMAFGAALLSWNLYEKHFLKLKRFF